MGKRIDLTGRVFDSLEVISYSHTVRSGHSSVPYWLCRCECGTEKVINGNTLKSGRAKCCGKGSCRGKYHNKHGLSKHRLHNIWTVMKQRCYDKNFQKYKDYGGRGITICEEWLHDFQAFYDWAMNNGYADNLSIDRIDVNGNYEPSNCRWATDEVQANNKTRNVVVEYKGEKYTLSQLSKKYNISYGALRRRVVDCGWNIEEAVKTPVVIGNNQTLKKEG